MHVHQRAISQGAQAGREGQRAPVKMHFWEPNVASVADSLHDFGGECLKAAAGPDCFALGALVFFLGHPY